MAAGEGQNDQGQGFDLYSNYTYIAIASRLYLEN